LDSISGLPYNEATMDYVDIPPGSVVARFRDAVYLKNSSVFTSLMACQFVVYKNKAAFDQRSVPNYPDVVPLNSAQLLDDSLGKSEDPLIIVVPSSGSPNQSTYQSSLTGRETDPKRKERWYFQ
jgi:hypothetical protein